MRIAVAAASRSSSSKAPQLEASVGIGVFLSHAAVDEAEEVVLRTDRAVEVGGVDAEGPGRRGLLLLGCGNGWECQESAEGQRVCGFGDVSHGHQRNVGVD